MGCIYVIGRMEYVHINEYIYSIDDKLNNHFIRLYVIVYHNSITMSYYQLIFIDKGFVSYN